MDGIMIFKICAMVCAILALVALLIYKPIFETQVRKNNCHNLSEKAKRYKEIMDGVKIIFSVVPANADNDDYYRLGLILDSIDDDVRRLAGMPKKGFCNTCKEYHCQKTKEQPGDCVDESFNV